MPNAALLFHVDALSLVMMALVGFVSLTVASFSARYLQGDRQQLHFYCRLLMLVITVFIMVSADHILLLLLSWGLGNGLLTRLMLHKSQWPAARYSARLASRHFAFGWLCLAAALTLLYLATGETSIQTIIGSPLAPSWALSSGFLLILVAMTQSALWPCHLWLTSSLNSPTPVSAIMHAGLVNGGGFLLARFAHLLSANSLLMDSLFVLGMLTALLGTLWKLMQNDVKRMLACSTMGQMGFMIAQCGLGLFPAAVAHLCWHGLFKAYLFLGSGSAAQEKRLNDEAVPDAWSLILALILGSLGAMTFSLSSRRILMTSDTSLFLSLMAMITASQLALTILRSQQKIKILLAPLASILVGLIYGLSVRLIEGLLDPVGIFLPQAFSGLHGGAFLLLCASWLSTLLLRPTQWQNHPEWLLMFYTRMLNASQPHRQTITAIRRHYHF